MSLPPSPVTLEPAQGTTISSTIHCQGCGYCGYVLTAHHGYKWWMLPLGFLLACTGIGLIPLAVILILLGNRTFQACPNCRGTSLLQWAGSPSPESQRIWTRAKEADDKAFKTNKLILLAIVMAMLAAALVFMIIMLQKV
jgi:hypothetical protein